MRNEIKLTDEQIEERFVDHCIDIDDLVFTRDTIQNFIDSSKSYREYRTQRLISHDHLEIRGAQIAKGQARFDIDVIDFGTVRAALTW